jgi:gluconolactonase
MTHAELAQIYPLGPDSLAQPGVPAGRVEKHEFNTSRIYPGTERDYWIYVPAQYRPRKAACVLVVQDGHDHLFSGRWNMAVVLDNLIHQKAMPVTIGVFLNPGKIPAPRPGGLARDNRSFEYDSAGDRYARFVLEEILPTVSARYTLRTDGNSRAIMGGSSGGFCAFNTAWCRPDAFQRVVSMVGSFTPMRGGHTMAAQVRLTAPKPLKVFLQGGAQDLDVVNGNWWIANLAMLSALQFAGYDVQHVWDERAGHNEFHCNMICPDALRWVWRDYPKQSVAGRGSKQPIAHLLSPQKTWQAVELPGVKVGAWTTDAAGDVVFVNDSTGELCRWDEAGGMVVLASKLGAVAALAPDQHGGWFVAQRTQKQILHVDERGHRRVHATNVTAGGLCALPDGMLYAAETKRNRITLMHADGRKRIVAKIASPVALALIADASQIVVATADTADVRLAAISPDGMLAAIEPYFFRISHQDAIVGLTVARPGWLVTATTSGIQFNNSNGLPSGLMRSPTAEPNAGVGLAGPNRDRLWIAAGGRFYRRRIKLLPTLWC